ncbi:hypothetical protein [Lihuaxuella thermophila]|uniref:Uncharacterized protein n=1 Tax=Lihuaxuella thermophila TaxID=1173111 RepID=A0A1H8DX18_9BACL|nr:hypothetical protein [Lihuaxuella thermophila]SEN11851.1 hypothetical protein SAMN05444955_10623 [Lihuaxuella thermophila]
MRKKCRKRKPDCRKKKDRHCRDFRSTACQPDDNQFHINPNAQAATDTAINLNVDDILAAGGDIEVDQVEKGPGDAKQLV